MSSPEELILGPVNPNEVAHMVSLLKSLTEPDTDTIRRAEAALKPALKQSASMNVLWAVVVNHTATATIDPNVMAGVRHSATLVLRKRLPTHYGRWKDPNVRVAWQRVVLQALAVEPSRPVRMGLLGVAAALASVTASDGAASTTLYLEFIAAAATNADAAARELCFLLLAEMTDVVGNHWKEHAASLVQLYQSVLQQSNEAMVVQTAAVRALGQLLSYWADEQEVETLAPLLPLLLQVAARHVQVSSNDDEDDLISTVLDVLYDLAYSSAPALIPHVPVTIEFALSCLVCQTLSLRVRDAAALVIATTAEAKPKTLGKQTALVGHVLDALFTLMQDSSVSAAGALFESNPAWRRDLDDGAEDDDDDEDDERDAPTETSMAQGTLDMLACELPKRYIWQPAYTRCLARMAMTDNALARKAGVAGLGVIAEGCAEPLTECLPKVMPLLFAACVDESPPVRECACFCLGQISEHCQPEILQYAGAILPTVFHLLDDNNVAVQATSCYVLEMFCERLEPAAVRPVLDPLVRKLAAMLEVPLQKRSVQEMAVAALAATSVAAEAEFTPYVPGVATLLAPFLQATAEAQFSLRGRALECMGHMAIAVGQDAFRPYFAPTMACAMEGLTLNSTDLQEFAYAVFANLAKVMRDEFAPALPDLVPFLIQVIEQEDGQFEENPEKESGLSGLDDSDDEDEEGGNMVLHVRTALLEVKKGALTALGEMAAHTGTSFCPFIEPSMQILQKAATEWHPDVRKEAAVALPSLVIPSIAAYHNGTVEWKRGDTTGAHSTVLSQHTLTIVHAVLQEEVNLLKDEEKATVGKACEAIQSVIELCGPASLTQVMPTLLPAALDLLTKTAPCYTAELYEDDDDGPSPNAGNGVNAHDGFGGAGSGAVDGDDDDHDVVIQAVCDLIGAFCRVLGGHFAPYLAQFLPTILDYAKSSRPTSDRSMAVGCLSEIAQECEGAIIDYWSTMFLPCLLAALGDADDNVKRNAAFCTGICAEHLRENIANDFPSLLAQLGPIFSLTGNPADPNSNTPACIDNAAAAVARMIMACPNQVPMAQVLPVFLSALPLKIDDTENETVYNCLIGLMGMNHPELAAHMGHVQRIVTQACQDDSLVDAELQGKLRAAAQAMSSSH